MNKLIGFQGFIGSGKDTAARHVLSRGDFVKDSFAATLKDICSVLFGWDRELLEGKTDRSRMWREKVDKWWAERLEIPNFTPRYALQYVGTQLFRNNFNFDIWLITFQKRILSNPNRNVLISDCRFPNEIDFFKNIGGRIILVDNGVKPDWYPVAIEANSGNADARDEMLNKFKIHESEWAWIGSKPDAVVMNDFKKKSLDTLEEFKRRVDNAVDCLFGL